MVAALCKMQHCVWVVALPSGHGPGCERTQMAGDANGWRMAAGAFGAADASDGGLCWMEACEALVTAGSSSFWVQVQLLMRAAGNMRGAERDSYLTETMGD